MGLIAEDVINKLAAQIPVMGDAELIYASRPSDGIITLVVHSANEQSLVVLQIVHMEEVK